MKVSIVGAINGNAEDARKDVTTYLRGRGIAESNYAVTMDQFQVTFRFESDAVESAFKDLMEWDDAFRFKPKDEQASVSLREFRGFLKSFDSEDGYAAKRFIVVPGTMPVAE